MPESKEMFTPWGNLYNVLVAVSFIAEVLVQVFMKISKIKTGNGVILLENRRPKDRNRTFSKKFATGDVLGIIFHNKLL